MLNNISRDFKADSTESRSLGFTLIEALVAILVLSVGLLGIAAMQLKATQSSHLAYNRSMATLAAQDAVERLWAEFGNPVTETSNAGECPSPSVVSADWRANWSSLLPLLPENEKVAITADPESSGDACKYLITVAWSDSRFSDEDVSTLLYVIKLPGS